MRLSINSCCQAARLQVCVSDCVCSCMEAPVLRAQLCCLQISWSLDVRCSWWRHHCTILTHTDSDMKSVFLCVPFHFTPPTPPCAVVRAQALQANYFVVSVNSTAFMILSENMQWFITVMKWIDGICELLTFTCLLAQWVSSKVNCVKLTLICSQRHGNDVGS